MRMFTCSVTMQTIVNFQRDPYLYCVIHFNEIIAQEIIIFTHFFLGVFCEVMLHHRSLFLEVALSLIYFNSFLSC